MYQGSVRLVWIAGDDSLPEIDWRPSSTKAQNNQSHIKKIEKSGISKKAQHGKIENVARSV
jgi:hypothetical protein